MQNHFLRRRLEQTADVVSCLVTFTPSVSLETLAQALSQFMEPVFTHSVPCTLQRVSGAVASDLYLAYFVPQRDSSMLCCAHGIELIITRMVFTRLCCA